MTGRPLAGPGAWTGSAAATKKPVEGCIIRLNGYCVLAIRYAKPELYRALIVIASIFICGDRKDRPWAKGNARGHRRWRGSVLG